MKKRNVMASFGEAQSDYQFFGPSPAEIEAARQAEIIRQQQIEAAIQAEIARQQAEEAERQAAEQAEAQIAQDMQEQNVASTEEALPLEQNSLLQMPDWAQISNIQGSDIDIQGLVESAFISAAYAQDAPQALDPYPGTIPSNESALNIGSFNDGRGNTWDATLTGTIGASIGDVKWGYLTHALAGEQTLPGFKGFGSRFERYTYTPLSLTNIPNPLSSNPEDNFDLKLAFTYGNRRIMPDGGKGAFVAPGLSASGFRGIGVGNLPPFLLQLDKSTFDSEYKANPGGSEWRTGFVVGSPMHDIKFLNKMGAGKAASFLGGINNKTFFDKGPVKLDTHSGGLTFWKGGYGSSQYDKYGDLNSRSLGATLAYFGLATLGPDFDLGKMPLVKHVPGVNQITLTNNWGLYSAGAITFGARFDRRLGDDFNLTNIDDNPQTALRNMKFILSSFGTDRAIETILKEMEANDGEFISYGEPVSEQLFQAIKLLDENTSFEASDYYSNGIDTNVVPLTYQRLSRRLSEAVEDKKIDPIKLSGESGLDFGIDAVAEANGDVTLPDYSDFSWFGDKAPPKLPKHVMISPDGKEVIDTSLWSQDRVTPIANIESIEQFAEDKTMGEYRNIDISRSSPRLLSSVMDSSENLFNALADPIKEQAPYFNKLAEINQKLFDDMKPVFDGWNKGMEKVANAEIGTITRSAFKGAVDPILAMFSNSDVALQDKNPPLHDAPQNILDLAWQSVVKPPQAEEKLK